MIVAPCENREWNVIGLVDMSSGLARTFAHRLGDRRAVWLERRDRRRLMAASANQSTLRAYCPRLSLWGWLQSCDLRAIQIKQHERIAVTTAKPRGLK